MYSKRAISLLMMILFPIFGLASSYYVSTSGDNSSDGSISTPWRDIDYAANTSIVVSGDTIHIAAGTYFEHVYINGKNVSLIGESSTNTIIDGTQTVGATTTHLAAIRLNNIQNSVIKNLWLKDVAKPLDIDHIDIGQYGIVLSSYCQNNILENIHVTNPGCYGIFIWNQCTTNSIRNCYVDGAYPDYPDYQALDGIFIHGGDNAGEVTVGTIVRDCKTENVVFGVSMTRSDKGLIEGNTIIPSMSSTWLEPAWGGYYSYGFNIYCSSNNTVANNYITGGYHNIRFRSNSTTIPPAETMNNIIINNQILGTSSSQNGINFNQRGSSYGIISGNHVINNSITGNVNGIYADEVNDLIQCNSIYGNTTGVLNLSTDSLYAQYNYWGAEDGPAPTGSGNPVSSNVVYIPFSGDTVNTQTVVVSGSTTLIDFSGTGLQMDFSSGNVGSGGEIFVALAYSFPTGDTPGGAFNASNSLKKVWSLITDMTGFNVTLIFSYEDADIPSGVNEASLIPLRSTDGGLTWEDITGSIVRDTVNNTITISGVTGFSLWAFGDSGMVPVELSDFMSE